MLYFIYLLIVYCIYEAYKYYQHTRRLLSIKKLRMPDSNNNSMGQLYLKKILEDEFFLNKLGLCTCKETKDLTHYELSLILNTLIFGRHRKISDTTQLEYDNIINQLENKYKLKFKKTDDRTFNSLFGLAEYVIFYKPQIFKFAIIGLKQIFNLYMRYLGYDIYYDNITHIKIIGKKTYNKNSPYYLFIHGFGIGLIPYYKFISKFKEMNLILIEIPNITLTYEFEYYDDRFIIITLENYLRQNKIKSKINVIAHSYGGFISQKIYNYNKDLFNKFYYIETPNLISLVPYLCYLFNKINMDNSNFLHRLLIYTDINVFLQLGRNDTSNNYCICPELYDKIYMFFATNDEIVNYNIAKYEVEKNNIKNYVYDGTHGEFLLDDKFCDKILNIIKEDNK
jgi:hypothetical protein